MGKCNIYARTSVTPNAASTSTNCGLNACMSYEYKYEAIGQTYTIAAGTCVQKTDNLCDTTKSGLESANSGFKDWECNVCQSDDCNDVMGGGVGNADGGIGLAPGLLSAAIALGLLA